MPFKEKPFYASNTAKLLRHPTKKSIRVIHKTSTYEALISILNGGLKSSYRLFQERWLDSLKFNLEDYPHSIFFRAPPIDFEEDYLQPGYHWVSVAVDPDKTYVFNAQLRVSRDLNAQEIYRNQVVTLSTWMRLRREGVLLQKAHPDSFVLIHPCTAENLLISKSSLYYGSDVASKVMQLMSDFSYTSPIIERNLWFREILKRNNYYPSLMSFPPLKDFYNSDVWLSDDVSLDHLQVSNHLPPFATCCEYFGFWEILVRQEQIDPSYIVDSSLHRDHRRSWGIKSQLPVSSEYFSRVQPRKLFSFPRKQPSFQRLWSNTSFECYSERYLADARQASDWSFNGGQFPSSSELLQPVSGALAGLFGRRRATQKFRQSEGGGGRLSRLSLGM